MGEGGAMHPLQSHRLLLIHESAQRYHGQPLDSIYLDRCGDTSTRTCRRMLRYAGR